MELFLLLSQGLVLLLLVLVGIAALAILFFLWMVSTRTRQDSKIFQERFDGWRDARRRRVPRSHESRDEH